MINDPHTLLMNLEAARRERDEAKKKVCDLSEKLGVCAEKSYETDVCYRENDLEPDEWCDVCKQKEPVWQAYHKAANHAGAALRACLRYAREHAGK
jgi:hypothetical protein